MKAPDTEAAKELYQDAVDEIMQPRRGQTWQTKTFTASTRNASEAFRCLDSDAQNVIMEIFAKEGTQALVYNIDEAEALFNQPDKLP